MNSGFGTVTTRAEAEELVLEGWADAVAVGRPAIANPDLALRWEQRAELNEPRPEFFYTGGAVGYTDYPLQATEEHGRRYVDVAIDRLAAAFVAFAGTPISHDRAPATT